MGFSKDFVGSTDQRQVLQSSLPKFVEAVKIADLGLGSSPLRIISVRALPDMIGDRDYPREEWIDQGKPPHVHRTEAEKTQDLATEDQTLQGEQAGDYVCATVFIRKRSVLTRWYAGQHGGLLFVPCPGHER